jgi:hypothetical protein
LNNNEIQVLMLALLFHKDMPYCAV